MASPAAFAETIKEIKDKHDTAILFSHNPGITEFANSLTNVHIDDMPTCSIFAVVADIEDWKDFDAAPKRLLFFDYPKNM